MLAVIYRHRHVCSRHCSRGGCLQEGHSTGQALCRCRNASNEVYVVGNFICLPLFTLHSSCAVPYITSCAVPYITSPSYAHAMLHVFFTGQ